MSVEFVSKESAGTDQGSVRNPKRRRPVRAVIAATAALGAVFVAMLAAPASADELGPVVGVPITTSGGQYSYIATPAVTRRLDSMNMARAIASLPLPEQYQPANLALAARFDSALAATRAARGSCLQIVVDPKPADGGVFNYGFFPVASTYCP